MTHLKKNRSNRNKSDGGRSPLCWFRAHLSQISEGFWFCLSFILFILLGPFSAIVVLIGLGSLAGEDKRQSMVEPARL